jgi:hypothetical protein
MNSTKIYKSNETIVRGDSQDLPVTFTMNSLPIDITGWTVYCQVKSDLLNGSAALIPTKTVTVHTDPTNGESLIEFTATETEGLIEGEAYFIIKLQTDDVVPKVSTPVIIIAQVIEGGDFV